MVMTSSLLTDRIHSLDDATARRVLTTFARAQASQAATELTPALAQALRDLWRCYTCRRLSFNWSTCFQVRKFM